MIAGLAVLSIALKMQNAEHDKTILMSTFVLLMAAGLAQHISNLTKIVFDILCSRLKPEVLQELQGRQPVGDTASNSQHETRVKKTRHILQYFGWTHMYGFAIVILFAVFSFTIFDLGVHAQPPLHIRSESIHVLCLCLHNHTHGPQFLLRGAALRDRARPGKWRQGRRPPAQALGARLHHLPGGLALLHCEAGALNEACVY